MNIRYLSLLAPLMAQPPLSPTSIHSSFYSITQSQKIPSSSIILQIHTGKSQCSMYQSSCPFLNRRFLQHLYYPCIYLQSSSSHCNARALSNHQLLMFCTCLHEPIYFLYSHLYFVFNIHLYLYSPSKSGRVKFCNHFCIHHLYSEFWF